MEDQELQSQCGSPTTFHSVSDIENHDPRKPSQMDFITQVPDEDSRGGSRSRSPIKRRTANTNEDLLNLLEMHKVKRTPATRTSPPKRAQPAAKVDRTILEGREVEMQNGNGRSEDQQNVKKEATATVNFTKPALNSEKEPIAALTPQRVDGNKHEKAAARNPDRTLTALRQTESTIGDQAGRGGNTQSTSAQVDPFESLRRGLVHGRFISRRLQRIPRDQEAILTAKATWQPPLIGERPAHGCIPPKLLDRFTKAADESRHGGAAELALGNCDANRSEERMGLNGDHNALEMDFREKSIPARQECSDADGAILDFQQSLSDEESGDEQSDGQVSWSPTPPGKRSRLPPDDSPLSHLKSNCQATRDVSSMVGKSRVDFEKDSFPEMQLPDESNLENRRERTDELPWTRLDRSQNHPNEIVSKKLLISNPTSRIEKDDAELSLKSIIRARSPQICRDTFDNTSSRHREPAVQVKQTLMARPRPSSDPSSPKAQSSKVAQQTEDDTPNEHIINVPATHQSQPSKVPSAILDVSRRNPAERNNQGTTNLEAMDQTESDETALSQQLHGEMNNHTPQRSDLDGSPGCTESHSLVGYTIESVFDAAQTNPFPGRKVTALNDDVQTKRKLFEEILPDETTKKRQKLSESPLHGSPCLTIGIAHMARAARREFFQKERQAYAYQNEDRMSGPGRRSSESSERKVSSGVHSPALDTPDTSVSLNSKPVSLLPQIAGADRTHFNYCQAYPSYEGTLIEFIRGCRLIRKLREQKQTVHIFLWDDFIYRHRHEYRVYQHQHLEDSEAVKSFFDYYHDEIEAPICHQGIVKPTFLEILGMDMKTSMKPPGAQQVGDIPRPLRQIVTHSETRTEEKNISTQPPTNQGTNPQQSVLAHSVAVSSSASNILQVHQQEITTEIPPSSPQLPLSREEEDLAESQSTRIESWLHKTPGGESPDLGSPLSDSDQEDVPRMLLDEVEESVNDNQYDTKDPQPQRSHEDVETAPQRSTIVEIDRDDRTHWTSEEELEEAPVIEPDSEHQEPTAWWHDRNTAFKEWARAHERITRRQEQSGLKTETGKKGEVLPWLRTGIDVASWRS